MGCPVVAAVRYSWLYSFDVNNGGVWRALGIAYLFNRLFLAARGCLDSYRATIVAQCYDVLADVYHGFMVLVWLIRFISFSRLGSRGVNRTREHMAYIYITPLNWFTGLGLLYLPTLPLNE